MVLASVAGGAALVAASDSTRPVLAVTRDLDVGSVLQPSDLTVVKVRLASSSARYFPATSALAGQALLVPIQAGQLLPRSAVGAPDPHLTTLTVPVEPENAPDVQRGQRVTVWVSGQYCAAVPVLADATVQAVRSAGSGALSSATEESVVVRVPPALAQRVVTALGVTGAVIRVGVLSGPSERDANADLADLSTCDDPRQSS